MPDSILEAALELAELGHPVVPDCYPLIGRPCTCDADTRARYPKAHAYGPEGTHVEGSCCDGLCDAPGKHPLVDLKEASTDPAQVRAWFQWGSFAGKPYSWHRPANLGMATGYSADVLDADRAMPPAVRDAMPARKTPMCRSSERRGHTLFEPEPPSTRPPGKLSFGEWRGRGHQVIVPPSLHPSGGRYSWEPGRSPSDCSPIGLTKTLRDALHKARYQRGQEERDRIEADPEALLLTALATLEAGGFPTREVGDGDWSARCPVHAPMDDPEPHGSTSLGLRVADDRLLVHCRAGCEHSEVVGALGIAGALRAEHDRERYLRDLIETAGALIELGRILDDIVDVLRRFIFVKPECEAYYDLLALWVVHTWLLSAFSHTPRLRVRSATKRSGKSRIFDVIAVLLPVASTIVSPTAAAFVRSIDGRRVFLLDEMDMWYDPRRDTDVVAMLNAGYRAGATVPKAVPVGDHQWAVEHFPVFAAVAYAGITGKNIPDTLADRSIEVLMSRRRSSDRTVARLKVRTYEKEAQPLRDRIEAWALANRSKVTGMADHGEYDVTAFTDNDRAREVWEPLMLLATIAGPEWVARCDAAAAFIEKEQALVGEDADSPALRLVRDVYEVMVDPKLTSGPTPKVTTDPAWDGDAVISVEDLLTALLNCHDEYGRWGPKGDRSITAAEMSRLLKPFGISSKRRNLRPDEDGYQGKGSKAKTPSRYRLAPVADAYVRYGLGDDDDDDEGHSPSEGGDSHPDEGPVTPCESIVAGQRPISVEGDTGDTGDTTGEGSIWAHLPMPFDEAVERFGGDHLDALILSGEVVLDGATVKAGEPL